MLEIALLLLLSPSRGFHSNAWLICGHTSWEHMGGLWDNLIACRSKRRDCKTKKYFYEGIFIFHGHFLGSTNIRFLGTAGLGERLSFMEDFVEILNFVEFVWNFR